MPMSRRPYYRWYPADYTSDTQELSDMADLIYRRMLDALWLNDGYLSIDNSVDKNTYIVDNSDFKNISKNFLKNFKNIFKKFPKILKISPYNFYKYFPEIAPYFKVDGNKIYNQRLLNEMEQVIELSEKKSIAGKLGQAVKKQKEQEKNDKQVLENNDKQVLKHSDSDSDSDLNVNNCSSSIGKNLDQKNDSKSVDNFKLTDQPPKPPKCPINEIVKYYHQILPMGRRCKDVTPKRENAIRALWKNRLKTIEAWINYFTYCAESNWLTGKILGRNGTYFEVNIDYLLKLENLVNIYEGKYHRSQLNV